MVHCTYNICGLYPGFWPFHFQIQFSPILCSGWGLIVLYLTGGLVLILTGCLCYSHIICVCKWENWLEIRVYSFMLFTNVDEKQCLRGREENEINENKT